MCPLVFRSQLRHNARTLPVEGFSDRVLRSLLFSDLLTRSMSSAPQHGESTEPLLEPLLESRLQTLGLALRQGRESSGRSLELLAQQLHMGVEQLRALEEGDRPNLPELVFVIAQARRVASYLNLGLDGPINDLRHCSSTTAAPDQDRLKNQFPEAPPSEVGALASLLDSSSAQTPDPAPPADQIHTKRHPQPSPAGRAWRPVLAAIVLLAGVGSAGLALWRQGLLPIPAARSTDGAAPAMAPTAKRTSPSSASASVAGTVLLSASQPSWLEVRTPQGAQLHFGLLQGQQRFANRAGLQVRAGRPDLITVTSADGASRRLGRIEDLRWWLIQPDGRIQPLPGPSS